MKLENLTVEHQVKPIGLDIEKPRFGWVITSEDFNVKQEFYQIKISTDEKIVFDTDKINSEQSIEVVIKDLVLEPKTPYEVAITVWDNKGNFASDSTIFETGFLGTAWKSSWVEPEQIPTEYTMDFDKGMESFEIVTNSDPNRDYKEFQPVHYLRIPFTVKENLKKARIYMTAHGIYTLEINGTKPDDREFAPENSTYERVLMYQTYDISDKLIEGDNIVSIALADGWWSGRVGASGDTCQYGNTKGILFQGEITYSDGSIDIITGENAKSTFNGPLIFSDIFVGEKYDARKELNGWNTVEFQDFEWKKVNKVDFEMNNLYGQYGEPVRPIKTFKPLNIIKTPKGETVLDLGQVIAGQVEFTIDCEEGREIRLEHSEVLDSDGNYFNNILGINKEQTDFYITKNGKQSYRPIFTYHGFRYVKITGWTENIDVNDFTAYVLSSEMKDLGNIETDDERINRLIQNIWWSQVSNTLSIPTDCPQRERAGWTGDIMAFAPTLLLNRDGNAFLTRWMKFLREDQGENGSVPSVVPYLKAYQAVMQLFGTETSCGWGDAVLIVPLSVYKACGDTRILEENYVAMKKWLSYIQNRAENTHPDAYEEWDEEHKKRSKFLWNTDFHFGDWLVPSMVLGNTDGGAMIETAFKTKDVVAPAYYAFSAKSMAEIANVLGNKEDEKYFTDLYENIRKAFIEEYVNEDGTIDANLQGLYVIALKNNLVSDEVKPKMVNQLRTMIKENNYCLDTGFLSILFLMDVLCENNSRDLAYKLLFQTNCPSWLYEVDKGATTMWESWGAIGKDNSVSTYSYNHYAFGCVGEWIYREVGGIKSLEAGYKKIKIEPALDCGLKHVKTSQYTPYGQVCVEWKYATDNQVSVTIEIPVNTTAEINLPSLELIVVGSGKYKYTVNY